MPYTLSKGLLWFLIALLIGVIVGWLLRSVTATRQLRAARSGRAEPGELERLRMRLAELEPVTAERDRLRAELADLRAAPPGGEHRPGGATDLPQTPELDSVTPGPSGDVYDVYLAGLAAPGPERIDAEPADMVGEGQADQPPPGADEHLPELDADGGVSAPAAQALAAAVDPLPEDASPAGVDDDEPPLPEALSTEPAEDTEPADDGVADLPATTDDAEPVRGRGDLDTAAVVLGKRVRPDDLTAIEGVGPAIAGLCHGIGIHTWADMAETEVSLLRTMLADAGPRFSVHRPDTWPQQAALLAAGRWHELKELVSRSSGSRIDG